MAKALRVRWRSPCIATSPVDSGTANASPQLPHKGRVIAYTPRVVAAAAGDTSATDPPNPTGGAAPARVIARHLYTSPICVGASSRCPSSARRSRCRSAPHKHARSARLVRTARGSPVAFSKRISIRFTMPSDCRKNDCVTVPCACAHARGDAPRGGGAPSREGATNEPPLHGTSPPLRATP